MRYLLSLLLLTNFMSFSQVMELEWSFLHPLKKEWIELGGEGTVQEALINSGELPDPFKGLNEEKFGWIEDYEWEFKSLFFVDKQMKKEFVDIEFPSIDTYAKVYLNGTLILTADNAFIPHRTEIKDNLKEGLNELSVIFTPPIIYHKSTVKDNGFQLPAPNDKHETMVAPYTRKPQYQFGWDWALRMNTIGFNKPASIHAYDNFRVLNKTVKVVSVEKDKAILKMDIQISNCDGREVVWDSENFGIENVRGETGWFSRTVEVKNPRLWWPRGHGEQYLYEDDVKLTYSSDKQSVKNVKLKYGIKTSELVQEQDEWGTSYYFRINGRRIFCKGADYIPQEIFPSKVEDKQIVAMVKAMEESNFNMVRVWGGGYYPDDIFFEACDSLGIMVWQDLMFACAMYPGDDQFIENISKEFRYQIPRISGHSSVVLFNGNNEVDVAWSNWGFQIKYGLYGKSARTIEQAYDLIFKKVAPAIVEEWCAIPYVHTSPLSNWGKLDFYNHGSQHYWGVWHGKDPIEDFGTKIGRFNAEYGFQSFPEYNTLHSFADSSDWNLDSEVMKHHQKSYVGNDMIMKHAKRLYDTPKDFEEFVYYSQLTQAMAVSMAVAGHRIDSPRCGGTLYWQLNDCWPAPTWSSIDYFGNWKALQYKIKEDYQDISIVAKYKSVEERSYYLISDLVDTFECYVSCKVYDLQGNFLKEVEMTQQVTGQCSIQLDLTSDGLDSLLNQNVVLNFQFKDNEGKLSSRHFDNIVNPYEPASKENVKLHLEKIDLENKTAVLRVETNTYLRKLWISSNEFGVSFNRNFISLLPGNTYFHIKFEELPVLGDFKLKWL